MWECLRTGGAVSGRGVVTVEGGVVTGDPTSAAILLNVERSGRDGPAVNGASFVTGLARGSISALYGSDPSSGIGEVPSVPLPRALADVQLLAGTETAPLFYVSPVQVNFQVTFETPLGRTSIQVVRSGGAGPTWPVEVTDDALGVFQHQSASGELAPLPAGPNLKFAIRFGGTSAGEVTVPLAAQ